MGFSYKKYLNKLQKWVKETVVQPLMFFVVKIRTYINPLVLVFHKIIKRSVVRQKKLLYFVGGFAIIMTLITLISSFPGLVDAQGSASGAAKSGAKAATGASAVVNAAAHSFSTMQSFIVSILSWIVYAGLIWPMSLLVLLGFNILTNVASYNQFVTSAAVVKGWIIVRDLANMSIIIFLLIIAFSIMLRIETYKERKILVNLLIMAVLINFSKTICGLFIDMSQVVMLTFVNGFKIVTGATLLESLNISKFLSYGTANRSEPLKLLQVLASIVLTALFMFAILAVIFVIIITLLWRIVNLWMLVILSPIAFLSSAVPFLQKFYSQWKTKFSNFLISGPLLAFFLWLSLTIMSGLESGFNTKNPSILEDSGASGFFAQSFSTTNIDSGLTEAFTTPRITMLMISLGLLVGSLTLAAEFGAAGASAALGLGKKVAKVGTKKLLKAVDGSTGAITQGLIGRNLSVGSGIKLAKRGGLRAKGAVLRGLDTSSKSSTENVGLIGLLRRGVASGGSSFTAKTKMANLETDVEAKKDGLDQARLDVKNNLIDKDSNVQSEVGRQKDFARLGALKGKGALTTEEEKEHNKIEKNLGISPVLSSSEFKNAQKEQDVKVQDARNVAEASIVDGKLIDNDSNVQSHTLKYKESQGKRNAYSSKMARRRTLPTIMEANKNASEYNDKKETDIKKEYSQLDDKAEIRDALLAALEKSKTKVGRVQGYGQHVQVLMKMGAEQGHLDEIMNSDQIKGSLNMEDSEVGASGKGVRRMLNLSKGKNKENDKDKGQDSKALDSYALQFIQKIDSLSKKGGGSLSLSNLTDIDSSGAAYWQDQKVDSKTGFTQQQDSNMKILSKGGISAKDRTSALVSSGQLNPDGKRFYQESAGAMKTKFERDNTSEAEISAFMNIQEKLREGLVDKVADSNYEGYDNSKIFQFDSLVKTIREKRSGKTHDAVELGNRRIKFQDLVTKFKKEMKDTPIIKPAHDKAVIDLKEIDDILNSFSKTP